MLGKFCLDLKKVRYKRILVKFQQNLLGLIVGLNLVFCGTKKPNALF